MFWLLPFSACGSAISFFHFFLSVFFIHLSFSSFYNCFVNSALFSAFLACGLVIRVVFLHFACARVVMWQLLGLGYHFID
ncbi:hypothetical protein BZA05DRAFT_7588 [Tricharina praecox]|uniref:uncharacterized protein n=1 Tax=Tricharina praecox TaxID=43433 RepID=UPI002220A35F|nr:uncharacterized protein BZA05DRAFT_7588 [Tricharina praecox]KAI5858562.1 hypothetical protein BZA05DRAFT_7588 [Tricharina praecox]